LDFRFLILDCGFKRRQILIVLVLRPSSSSSKFSSS